jgi:hypothetical protein
MSGDTVRDDRSHRIEHFKTRQDSLRIPASRISALAGYHPYAVLPQLFLDLIYQGQVGEELRVQDAHELGVMLLSTDHLLMELAKKAGKDTAKALYSALQVRDGTCLVSNVKAAENIKRKVFEEANKANKLSRQEISQLVEGTRNYVNTGFGTHNEGDALDLFEKKCGWEIKERNSALLYWPFLRAEDMRDIDQGDCEKTVVALAPASAFDLTRGSSTEPWDYGEKEPESRGSGETSRESPAKPFFVISGAVDGVRDELWCPPGQTSNTMEYEQWELRKVIVECKHRMRAAYNTPPLYDQIQTTAYCLMYGTEEADIIQVLRQVKDESRPAKRLKGAKHHGLSPKSPDDSVKWGQRKISDLMQSARKSITGTSEDPSSQSAPLAIEKTMDEDNKFSGDVEQGNIDSVERVVDEKDAKPASEEKENKPEEIEVKESTIEIVTWRMSLSDPVMNHKFHWQSIILPRLRSIVEAIYLIRANDEERKLFLQVVTNEEQNGYETRVSWDMLHRYCPWLEECDTALRRLSKHSFS